MTEYSGISRGVTRAVLYIFEMKATDLCNGMGDGHQDRTDDESDGAEDEK